MITQEQLEEALDGDNKTPFQTKDIDHDLRAINLLRERIPYEVCRSIIGGAEHDVLYLCDVEKAIPYLREEDLEILADCNVWLDNESDSLALFV